MQCYMNVTCKKKTPIIEKNDIGCLNLIIQRKAQGEGAAFHSFTDTGDPALT